MAKNHSAIIEIPSAFKVAESPIGTDTSSLTPEQRLRHDTAVLIFDAALGNHAAQRALLERQED